MNIDNYKSKERNSMALFTKNFRQFGINIFLLFMICILAGCTSQKAPSGISDEEPVETENALYEIGEQETESGISYPQIVLKGEEDILCGAKFLNNLLENKCMGSSYAGYKVFYADENIFLSVSGTTRKRAGYLSLW